MTKIILPRRPRGRPTAASAARWDEDVGAFCAGMVELDLTIDFPVGPRGWCYILEEHGLSKAAFDDAERLIGICRKNGALPIDLVAADPARAASGIEEIDDEPAKHAGLWANYVLNRMPERYLPFSFWDDQEYFVVMIVEKMDLKSLFEPVCAEFHVPIYNGKGWIDTGHKAELLRTFKAWGMKDRPCVILYCGDHDPAGLNISNCLMDNLKELAGVVGWNPERNVQVDRFGLNADFIEEQGLTWIENLKTGGKKDLADPNHHFANAPFVKNYIEQFGERKCEANALVVRPEAGRELCRQAILKYVPADAPERYEAKLAPHRDEMRRTIRSELWEMLSGGAGA